MSDEQALSVDFVSSLPVVQGFRQRGLGTTRLETFTDAAFAFAVTLLVVGGGDSIPVNFEEMAAAMRQVPAFAASFANIMLFWHAHHVWSRRFGLDDSRSIIISLLLIFVVLIYVYPLKAIFSGAMHFFSNGYLESYFGLQTMSDLRIMFVIFGAGFALLSLTIVMLNRHALSRATYLDLDRAERFHTRSAIQHWYINVVVSLVSIALAIALPDRWVVVAGMIYGIFAVALPLHHRYRRRKSVKQITSERL